MPKSKKIGLIKIEKCRPCQFLFLHDRQDLEREKVVKGAYWISKFKFLIYPILR